MITSTFEKIIYVIIVLFLCWGMYVYLKNNPQWLTKENLSKSSFVMGILALALIAFIGICVVLLRG